MASSGALQRPTAHDSAVAGIWASLSHWILPPLNNRLGERWYTPEADGVPPCAHAKRVARLEAALARPPPTLPEALATLEEALTRADEPALLRKTSPLKQAAAASRIAQPADASPPPRRLSVDGAALRAAAAGAVAASGALPPGTHPHGLTQFTGLDSKGGSGAPGAYAGHTTLKSAGIAVLSMSRRSSLASADEEQKPAAPAAATPA